jgi:hypothetical protein
MAHEATLQALESRPYTTRPRPPAMNISPEVRIPLRPEKVSRRESRLGLRSLFGRSKPHQDDEKPAQSTSHEYTKTGGIRTSLFEVHDHAHAGRKQPLFEVRAPNERSQRPLSISVEEPEKGQLTHLAPGDRNNRAKTANGRVVKSRDSIVASSTPSSDPPLFKAYPQAIMHATLPATTISADSLLRLSEKNGETAADMVDGDASNDREKRKRRARRNNSLSADKLEWTTKIFILATSGHLLQYSHEGPFDRAPEKVLQLSRYSAAFVCDMIPGQHWVLQVTSTAEPENLHAPASATESRSLLSKIAFRPTAVEKRSASNLLLVFEGAAELDGWMSALRHEIEKLGGKKKLSETGKPATEVGSHLREQPSQRTLVVRDPVRFSRDMASETSWNTDTDTHSKPRHSIAVTDPDLAHEQSLDDGSTTNSWISQDGRQLDALRDSANRLSFISSGQRTMITSAGSSPACSPTAEQFSTEQLPLKHEAQPRPNASSIVDRRRSLQTIGPFVEPNGVQSPGSHAHSAALAITPRSESTMPAYPYGTTPPNFSLPNNSNRRFSSIPRGLPTQLDFATGHQFERDHANLPTVRKMPSTLGKQRPLSMVVDQPSPRQDMFERPSTAYGDSSPLAPAEAGDRPPIPPRSLSRTTPSHESVVVNDSEAAKRTSVVPRDAGGKPVKRLSPRRLASTGTLRPREESVPRMRSLMVQGRSPEARQVWTSEAADEFARSNSVMGTHAAGRSRSPLPRRLPKRSSMCAVLPYQAGAPSEPSQKHMTFVSGVSLAPAAPPPTAPLPALPTNSKKSRAQFLQIAPGMHAIHNRRSMPQLVDGPPPAPPPTCALPPLPPTLSARR